MTTIVSFHVRIQCTPSERLDHTGQLHSMDEDVFGDAQGSYDPGSKTVMAKTALQNLVNTYAAKDEHWHCHVFLDEREQVSDHNSPYFTSYDPKNYCPNPPADCVNYCQTGNATS